MIVKEYVMEIITNGQKALTKLEEENLTVNDLQLVFGFLDHVEERTEAAKLLLREKMKEYKNK
jgi:hypothetical protein